MREQPLTDPAANHFPLCDVCKRDCSDCICPEVPDPLDRCVECDEQYCDAYGDLDEPVHRDCDR